MPLYYDARGEELGVAIDDLNERIADKLEELEIEDIDVAQRLEQELKRDYHVVTAGSRLDQVARDFVRHYSNAWETGKAMLVCIDKVTCVRMHALIGRYWDERIDALNTERAQTPDEQEAIDLKRQIDWMRETRIAVVVSEEQGELDKFRRWELDITPHRRLVKEGMDLPESMRNEPRFRNMQRMAIDDAFKAEAHPFRIAIVCAMWLTGFDVPSLSTLYLDKPLKAHTLMQAIARANRVNEGKNNGLIVDYCGILRHLRKALALPCHEVQVWTTDFPCGMLVPCHSPRSAAHCATRRRLRASRRSCLGSGSTVGPPWAGGSARSSRSPTRAGALSLPGA